MAYTPSKNKSKSSYPTLASNFSNLQVDAGRNSMTGVLGNRIQTQDATPTSPVTSPATVNTATTLIVPQNAAQLTVVSTTNAVQVSEDSTSGESFAVPAGVIWTFDVANQQDVYLKTGSSTVVNFYFTII
jgi:hypothetical protein